MKIVLVTGGFDPLHSGHIAYFKAAKALGDRLVVGVNSDQWLTQKKGRSFMPIFERMNIIRNLEMVDDCIVFDDNDGSAIDAIKNLKILYPNDDIIFANGGDRTKENIPEMIFDDVEFVFSVGGEDKKNSSRTGDVLEPEGDIIGIGSGGNYALAAGKVLMETNIGAEEIAKKAIQVASEICVFTNNNIKIEKI